MKQISELTFDASVKYASTHAWAKTAGDLIVVGITDYAQDQLGEIIYVELPQPGDTFNQGDEFGMVESAKTSSELYMPVGGEIVEINSQLEK